MISLSDYMDKLPHWLQTQNKAPWEIVDDLEALLANEFHSLSDDYIIQGETAIHKTAVIEAGVILKGQIIVSENCFIASHAYLRGPVFLGQSVKIGPGTEVKQSIILENTAFAHFNYVGNSIIGSNINFEAGSICANHFNEREDKTIFVNHRGQRINTQTTKFGALAGDGSKIGANAVLSPGTLLEKETIVNRLELVEQ